MMWGLSEDEIIESWSWVGNIEPPDMVGAKEIAKDQLNKLVTGLIVRTTTTKNFARFKMSMVEWRELLEEAGI